MGTSSARRGPTTRLWRQAKAAATRYLAPESSGAVDAREVAARYVAALEEGGGPGPGGALASFRLTRMVAQSLGAFSCQANSSDWLTVLESWGLQDLAGEGPMALAQSLSAALGPTGGGLEPAVARAALVGVLLDLSPPPEAAPLVRRFLARAFHRRLALDLGESLEAAAPGFSPLQQGLNELAAWIDRAMETGMMEPPPLTPEHWLGLPGWTWATGRLEALLKNLRARHLP